MSEIYRVRPANQKTIEELSKPYLWFSKPTAFNDTEDANLQSFTTSNESIAEGLSRLFSDETDFLKDSTLTGICCFSSAIPTSYRMKHYPAAGKGVVIVYDKQILEQHFINTRGLGDCFKKISYLDDPTTFKNSNGYDILWEKNGEDLIYKAVRTILADAKETDSLFLKMYTRLATKYRRQCEHRIILAGRHIPSREVALKGYQIEIPKESILHIYTHKDCDTTFIKQLETLGFKVIVMEK